ncbi:iron-sulfur cluster assembly protein [Niabella sp. W65]|nr:iron-sulfur cluster assembly protein [Niabella sp. W65]MCH7362220.1 iron-sulfur cluster assembly protein [Niabella sp. W65]ULT45965.1 iron-sulfur cluster assembly protein [Niabella sp. I65]
MTKEKVLDALKTVYYAGNETDIVSAGIVQDLNIEKYYISFSLIVDTTDADVRLKLKSEAIKAIKEQVNKDAIIKVAFQNKPVAETAYEQEPNTPLSGVKKL